MIPAGFRCSVAEGVRCERGDSNPHGFGPPDPKSGASTIPPLSPVKQPLNIDRVFRAGQPKSGGPGTNAPLPARARAGGRRNSAGATSFEWTDRPARREDRRELTLHPRVGAPGYWRPCRAAAPCSTSPRLIPGCGGPFAVRGRSKISRRVSGVSRTCVDFSDDSADSA